MLYPSKGAAVTMWSENWENVKEKAPFMIKRDTCNHSPWQNWSQLQSIKYEPVLHSITKGWAE